MAVKIRLTRIGKNRQPSYRVVVADSRSPRDGANIEQIGRYDPRQEPSVVEIDNERAAYWIARGAQPSAQVKKLLEISGAMPARAIKEGRIHVVGEASGAGAAPASDATPAGTDKVLDLMEEQES
jgi:small subunit ribosomal protein S16